MPLSTSIDTLIRNSPGRTVRSSSEPVAEELDALGISPSTQVATFFVSYVATSLSSPVSGEELLDLCSPTPQIREATDHLCSGTLPVPNKSMQRTGDR